MKYSANVFKKCQVQRVGVSRLLSCLQLISVYVFCSCAHLVFSGPPHSWLNVRDYPHFSSCSSGLLKRRFGERQLTARVAEVRNEFVGRVECVRIQAEECGIWHLGQVHSVVPIHPERLRCIGPNMLLPHLCYSLIKFACLYGKLIRRHSVVVAKNRIQSDIGKVAFGKLSNVAKDVQHLNEKRMAYRTFCPE